MTGRGIAGVMCAVEQSISLESDMLHRSESKYRELLSKH
jgi:hypothetical protein